jgi:hypothetical protein
MGLQELGEFALATTAVTKVLAILCLEKQAKWNVPILSIIGSRVTIERRFVADAAQSPPQRADNAVCIALDITSVKIHQHRYRTTHTSDSAIELARPTSVLLSPPLVLWLEDMAPLVQGLFVGGVVCSPFELGVPL